MRWAPHGGQMRAIKHGVANGRVAIWMDPGLGKTSVSYAIAKILKQKKLVRSWLVVAPLPVVMNVWPKERSKWDDFQDFTLKILHGPKKASRLREQADFYIINYEGLMWLAKELNRLKWTGKKMPFDGIIFDEASKMKNPNSQRFKLMKDWVCDFKRVIELTGTPATRSLEDIWSQIFLIDRGQSLGKFITWYRDTYFVPGGHVMVQMRQKNGKIVKKRIAVAHYPKHGAKQKIYDAIEHLVVRMDAADWLDLPPLDRLKIEVDLPPEAYEIYKPIEDDLVLKIKNHRIRVANAGVAVGKCLQVANGAVYDESGDTWEEIHQAKLEALQDHIDELQGNPLLVAYWFDHDRQRLEKFFPGLPTIGRFTKPAETTRLIEAWNRGELPVLAAQAGKVAYGLNLQEGPATHMCFFSMLYDLEIYKQFIHRLWRQGQKGRVICHHIIATGTVDEAAVKSLKVKDATQQDLLDAIKELNERRHAVQ